MIIKKQLNSTDEMMQFGQQIGSQLKGGEILELIGDVGAGKTTFTKGLARGLEVSETVQSPSFTISRVYSGRLRLVHYDFYRLEDPGIMSAELAENIQSEDSVVVIEWGQTVADILPDDRLRVIFASPSEDTRSLEIDNWRGGRL